MITINRPNEIKSKRVFKEVNKLILSGVRSGDINITFEFFCTDEVTDWIMNEFRKIKNACAFVRDNGKI